MIDRHLIGMQNRLLGAPAKFLADRGIRADWITLFGFMVGLCAVPLLALSAFIPALLCILFNRLLDGLDGAVARQLGPTDRGAFLDIAFDFFFYGAVPFGFVLADPDANALAAALLLLAFIGTGSSFLAFAAISHKRGEGIAEYPGKGLRFVGGLTEGAETIAIFTAMCLLPSAFATLAYLFAFLAALTTVTRWRWGWYSFGPK